MMKKLLAGATLAVLLGVSVGLSTLSAKSDGESKFKSKCGFCHSLKVDGKSVTKATTGPELTGIAGKRPEKYIKLYMVDPEKARKEFAEIYLNEVKGKYTMKMPRVDLTEAEVNTIYSVLK